MEEDNVLARYMLIQQSKTLAQQSNKEDGALSQCQGTFLA
jgi:hypothetical protein